jgi:tetratricopeptide (TPR) repeat protein
VPDKVRVPLIIAASIAAPAWLALAGCVRQEAAPPPAETLLEIEVPIETLAKGHELTLPQRGPGYRLIEIAQRFADVRVEVTVGQAPPFAIDSAARRASAERVCLYSQGEVVRLRLSAMDFTTRADARIGLRAVAIDLPAGRQPPMDLQAECLETQGALDHEQWDPALAKKQVEKYQQAALIWRRTGALSRAANAQLQSAWLFTRRTTDMVGALAAGQLARREFQEAADTLGAARASVQIAVPRWELADAGRNEAGQESDDSVAMLRASEREVADAIRVFDAAGDAYYSAEARNTQGSNYYQLADYAEAIRWLTEASRRFRDANEPQSALRALGNVNAVLNQLGNYRDAANAFEQLLTGDLRDAPKPVLGDILNNSAATHSAAGNYDLALNQFLRALQIQESEGDAGGRARSLNGLAITYMRLGNPRAALAYAQQAVAEQAKVGKEASRSTMTVTSQLLAGDAWRLLGLFDRAYEAHTLAFANAQTDVLRTQACLALVRDAIAMSDPKTAAAQLAKAERHVPQASVLSQQIELERGRLALQRGDLGAAGRAFRALRGQFLRHGAIAYELEVLHGATEVELRAARLDLALAINDEAIALLRSLRSALGNAELRAQLTATHRTAYDLRASIIGARRATESAPDVRSALLRELLAAEDEARAGLIHEMGEARAVAGEGASPALRAVAAEIAFRESRLAAGQMGPALPDGGARIRAELERLRTQFDTLLPKAATKTRGFAPVDYATAGLRRDVAILVYLRQRSGFQRLVITADGFSELEPIGKTPLIAELTRQSLAGSLSADLATIAARILPVEPVASKRELIVVADGALAGVPFVALPFRGQPLVASHDITMALTVRDALQLARKSPERTRVALDNVAVFADPVFARDDDRLENPAAEAQGLRRLKATAREAAGIAARLPVRAVQLYVGLDATRAAALSPIASRATVLHFATHAFASDAWPHGSGLQLTAFGRDGAPVSGYLSTLDLLSRRSVTDLVVLSACDTARGESTSAESVAGLARAFLGGGARRVVATRWPVPDASTSALMIDFYTRLAAGDSAAAALGFAQREFLTRKPGVDATHWAAFVLFERAPVN